MPPRSLMSIASWWSSISPCSRVSKLSNGLPSESTAVACRAAFSIMSTNIDSNCFATLGSAPASPLRSRESWPMSV
jgi:hypothetical protein